MLILSWTTKKDAEDALASIPIKGVVAKNATGSWVIIRPEDKLPMMAHEYFAALDMYALRWRD